MDSVYKYSFTYLPTISPLGHPNPKIILSVSFGLKRHYLAFILQNLAQFCKQPLVWSINSKEVPILAQFLCALQIFDQLQVKCC